MVIVDYDREKAVEYALRYALVRNANYYDFSLIGGDCTNFCSQCLYSGSNVMNYTETLGWYYVSASKRTPAWTGVEYFYNFLIKNYLGVGEKFGPYAQEISLSQIELGDFIQLGYNNGKFYHTLIVTDISNGIIKVSTHSRDALQKPLSSYTYQNLRAIHIIGVRKP